MNPAKLAMRAAAALERGELALADSIADDLDALARDVGPGDPVDRLVAQVACRCLCAGLNRARALEQLHRGAVARARADGVAEGLEQWLTITSHARGVGGDR